MVKCNYIGVVLILIIGVNIMTVKEFLFWHPKEEVYRKAKTYSITSVMTNILTTSGGLRNSMSYNNCRGIFESYIGSFSDVEVISFLKEQCVKAIAYGIETKDLNWKLYFLVAWDLKDYYQRVLA